LPQAAFRTIEKRTAVVNKSDLDQCCHESRSDIPWLLNGTLSDSAAEAVREHLKVCSDCQADLEAHENMRAAVLGSEVTPMMPATKAEDVISVVRSGRSQHSRSRRLPSRLQAIAASIAILGVAIALSFYLDRDGARSNQLFETATSGSSGGIDYVLQLQFEDGVTNPEKGRIVAKLEDVVKWTVSDRGDYEVHVQLTAPSLAALKDYEEQTAALAGVHSAKFTALQLPVR
jgi:hypothetical protein